VDSHVIAHLKRLLELLEGDPDFAREAREDPPARQKLLNEAGLDFAAAELAPFWALLTLKGISQQDFDCQREEFREHPLLALWRDWSRKQAAWQEREISAWVPWGDPRVSAWRARQLARVKSDVIADGRLTYSPLFAFELSLGCSAQCWFCAFDPPRLQGVFAYAPPNRELWRDLLETAWELFGPGCRSATCYHGTEPTDNPDYLRFLDDFREVFGNYPQTTTARPLKNLEWTRRLLTLRTSDPGGVDRFSVLGPQALRNIHRTFTPEDLLAVNLVIHQAGATDKALSGRAIARAAARPAEPPADARAERFHVALPPPLTIECVCGFLVNMVDRSIRLVSPCNASPLWPRGYQVHAEGTFRDAAEFRGFILQSVADHMPAHLGPTDRLAFRRGLRYERHDDGFSLIARYRRHDLRGDPRLGLLGDLLLGGARTVGGAIDTLVQAGDPLFALAAVSWIDRLYQGGLLAEPSQSIDTRVYTMGAAT